jgi:hypothetical protein
VLATALSFAVTAWNLPQSRERLSGVGIAHWAAAIDLDARLVPMLWNRIFTSQINVPPRRHVQMKVTLVSSMTRTQHNTNHFFLDYALAKSAEKRLMQVAEWALV